MKASYARLIALTLVLLAVSAVFRGTSSIYHDLKWQSYYSAAENAATPGDAQELLEAALHHAETFGADARLAATLGDLVKATGYEGDYQRSAHLGSRLAELRQQMHGSNARIVLTTLVGLANTQAMAGRYANAETTYSTIVLRNKLSHQLSDGELRLVQCALAEVKWQRGAVTEAKSIYRHVFRDWSSKAEEGSNTPEDFVAEVYGSDDSACVFPDYDDMEEHIVESSLT